MTTTSVLVQCAGALAVAAVAVTASAARAADDPALRAALQRLSARSVFFGHQSVGANLLDGLRDVAAEAGVTLRIAEVPRAAGVEPGVFAHGYVADNGDPMRKLRSFAAYLEPGAGRPVDVALMKFCYVDFHRGTDPAGLFSSYQATLRDLQARSPRTTFVHVTVPLTTPQGFLKTLAKRLMGRETAEAENARREGFNGLMRSAYQGKEPLFDLARLEATGPDGSPVAAEWEGRQVPVLAAAYTDDGGHLNAVGRRRVARELAVFLAGVPSRETPPAAAGARAP